MTQVTEKSPLTPTSPESQTVEMGAPPPLVFGGSLVAGLLLNRLLPIRVPSSRLVRGSGAILALSGFALVWTALHEMRQAGNSPDPRVPVKRVVTEGPYRYTRNPIYLGFAVSFAGLSLLARAMWPLFLLPSVLAWITTHSIRPEERHLEGKFGKTYIDYKERVGRWL